jgi:hypothetical protein
MNRSRLMIVVLLVLAVTAALAQTPDAKPTALRVTDVAVFKHGYGFVMAEGQATTQDGWVTFAETPQASLGTLWLYSPQAGVSVDRVVAEVKEVKQSRPAEDLAGLILANVGAAVTIRGGYGEQERVYQGVLQPPVMGPDRERGSDPGPAAAEEAAIWAAVPPRFDAVPKALAYVVVRTRGGDQFIPAGMVRDLTIPGVPKREAEVAKPRQVLSARLVSEGKTVAGEAPVGMGYLAKGLRWIPSYRLQLLGEGKLRLQLQGTVINDVVDLQDSRLHLVVGVPNFIQQDEMSPLSLQTAWTRLSSYFAPVQGRPQNMYSNAMMTQVAARGTGGGTYGAGDRAEGGGEGVTTPVLPVTGESVDELFFYEVPGVTLKRGARAGVAIFEETLPYEDVYSWKVVDEADYAYWRWSSSYAASNSTGRRSPDEEALAREQSRPKVWHCLRLRNMTKTPWTTAPALAVRDWQPIAQSMMLYTPIGGEVDVTTTVAPDIPTRSTEEETARKRDALNISGTHYDLITARGELVITNRKAQEARLVVTRELRGSVQEATDGGALLKLADAPARLDPMTRISWDLKIPAGTEKKLGYTYTVYVPM